MVSVDEGDDIGDVPDDEPELEPAALGDCIVVSGAAGAAEVDGSVCIVGAGDVPDGAVDWA